MNTIINEFATLKAKVEAIEETVPKVLAHQNDEFMKLLLNQTKMICELQEKCASQGAIIMNLIASIALSTPEVFATIRENSEIGLKQLSEQNLSESELARMLQNVAGITPEKKPHLWLVPKKPDPNSPP